MNMSIHICPVCIKIVQHYIRCCFNNQMINLSNINLPKMQINTDINLNIDD